MTLLARDPALWDTVFREPPARTRWIAKLAHGRSVLDVGCATGSLCAELAARGLSVAGVDVNARFIAAARLKCPHVRFVVGEMARFRAPPAALVCCLGTTFGYNLDHTAAAATLANLYRHVRPRGTLVIDTLNAIAMLGPRPFRAHTRHAFVHGERRYVALIAHRLELATQLLTEQVTWRIGARVVRDPVERLRLWFPQELAALVVAAGFRNITLFDGYGTRSHSFGGRRLVIVARKR
ncbi:MAG TPA: class I SAM-dependent methyltransferase [Kofleriaceae bacterium]|jgi:SAM-dependent methyltransferase